MSNSFTTYQVMDCRPPDSSVHVIPKHEYWSGFPFPSAGDLPDLGMEPTPPAFAGGLFPDEPSGKPIYSTHFNI